MRGISNRWALILAAGAGTRLSSLTRVGDGGSVPKQFCSLAGGPSLLEDTLERAYSIVARERTIVVVAAEHRRFWRGVLRGMPRENIVIQPRNRGTANGILLGAAAVLERDRDALLVVLPSDHFVGNEGVLRRAILCAFRSIEPVSRAVTLLGIKPERADSELGYIVCGAPEADGSYRIAEFVEKPSHEAAGELLMRSALWNSFILVARARAFADLISQRYPREVAAFLSAMRRTGRDGCSSLALEQLYELLPEIDFSRHVVEGANAPLKVVPVARCGWSDLGTPQRVAECLARLGSRRLPSPTAHLSLAEAHYRLTQAAAHAVQWA